MGIEEINNIIKAFKDAGMVIFSHSSFTRSLASEEADGPWRVTVDYHKLNYRVTPITAAISDVVSLLEKIKTVLTPGVQ